VTWVCVGSKAGELLCFGKTGTKITQDIFYAAVLTLKVFRCVRKIAKSDCWLRVCPSFRMEQLDSHWTDFDEISFVNFRKYVEKIQVSLKSDKNNGYFI
jgi:hypothetical protein